MKIIKRNGTEVDFDIEKIVIAISKANDEVPEHARISKHLMNAIAEDIQAECMEMPETPSVETVQEQPINTIPTIGETPQPDQNIINNLNNTNMQ